METIKSFLDSILGEYTPIMYSLDTNQLIPSGWAGVDWPYIIRALVFVIVLWSVLRIIGGLICRM